MHKAARCQVCGSWACCFSHKPLLLASEQRRRGCGGPAFPKWTVFPSSCIIGSASAQKLLGTSALKASSWGISAQQAPAFWKNGLGQSGENEPANKGWCPPPCCSCAGVRRGLDAAKSCVCPEDAILTVLAGRLAGLLFFTDLPSGKCLFAALDPWSRRKE